MSEHVRSLLLAMKIFCNENEVLRPARRHKSPSPGGGRSPREAWRDGVKARAARCDSLRRRAPHPAHLRCATLPLQGRVKRAIPSSQRDPRRSYVSGQVRIERISLPYPPLATCFCFPQKEGEAERRQTLGTTAASCDAARALLERARLTAFHHGSHLRELFHPKGSAQARLPGTWSERALPAFACPSPGSTSRPGHRAGGLIPKPPGSSLQSRPRAPHPLHLTACLR